MWLVKLFALNLFFLESSIAFACNEDAKILRSYKPIFAKGFKIDYLANGIKKIETNKGSYLLSKKDCKDTIKVPIRKIVATSTTYLPVLEDLNLESSLIAFSGTKYITTPKLIKRLGKIKELGIKLNREQLLKLNPDVIMTYAVDLGRNSELMQLKKLGLSIVINEDYLEKNPLARAEWSIFIASFFNKEDEAIEKFNSIVLNYNKLKASVKNVEKKPSVFIGAPYKGIWNSPAANSDIAILVSDAGGDYFFNNRKSSLSIKSNFEAIFKNFKKFNIWLTHNMWQNLNNVDKRLKYQDIEIYNNNRIVSKGGGNDYWSTGVNRPDLLLADLISIFHPQILKKHQAIWYKKLK